jgi:nitrate reductase NapA
MNTKPEHPKPMAKPEHLGECSPLTPALSPLKGEGVALDGGCDDNACHRVPAAGSHYAGQREPDAAQDAAQADAAHRAPSPLNGERAGVRGEAVRSAQLPSPLAIVFKPLEVSSTLPRRDFLKVSALAAASAFIAQRAGAATSTTSPTAPGADGLRWDKAPCRFCGTGCHVRVGVKDDKVVAIQGDQLADVNKGLLCVKGYHVGLALYGKDRLTTPLLRKNGKLEPISWDEAIETIAKRVMAAPDKFAIYGSGQWTIPEGYAANKLMKGGLSNNHIDPNARLCMASAVTGYLSTFGVDEPAGCYDDLDKCDVLIMWGNNMAEMHPVLFSRVIDRRSRGEKVTLIDIGTRRTRTTEFSDHYLEFKPQSDLAIMNGIAHLLIKNGTYDAKFVERFCNFRQAPKDPAASPTAPLFGDAMSFDDYKKALEPYTPEHVEKISGVPAAKIRLLGELFGRKDLRITSVQPRLIQP